jgi:hypothetical protein
MIHADRFKAVAIAQTKLGTSLRYLGECKNGLLCEDTGKNPFRPYLIRLAGPHSVDVERVRPMDYFTLFDTCTHAAQERRACELKGLPLRHVDMTI